MKDDNKDYVRKTFVINKGIVAKLQEVADSQDRKLNWLVGKILKEWCEKCEKGI